MNIKQNSSNRYVLYQREVDVDMLNAVKSVLAKIQDFYAENMQ